jgi:hypothetical protein
LHSEESLKMFARRTGPVDDPAARSVRNLFYGLGIAFVLLGFSLEMVPALAAIASPLAGRVCAGIGALILAVGRFGSDRLMQRCRSFVTGYS